MSLYERHIKAALGHYQEMTGKEYTYDCIRTPYGGRGLSKARYFVLCYLQAMPQGFSMPQMARMVRFDNHTSVLYALRRGHGHDGALLHKYEPHWSKKLFQDLLNPVCGNPATVHRPNWADIRTIGARNMAAMRTGGGIAA